MELERYMYLEIGQHMRIQSLASFLCTSPLVEYRQTLQKNSWNFCKTKTTAQDNQEAAQHQSDAQYQRIFMSANKNVPQLHMAKDMVAAVRQGATPFAAIQQRFSDSREEGLVSARNCGSQELMTCAKSLRVGQVSDPVVDKAGVHILMRVS